MALTHWSAVLNFLMQNYFGASFTTCIIWHHDFEELQLETIRPILNIWPATLEDSFEHDIYNFSAKDLELERRGIKLNDDVLTKKLTVAIEQSNCESFLAFQNDIPKFARAFYRASTYSVWRSERNRFIFAYVKDLSDELFDDYLFEDQPNLLLVEAPNHTAAIFDIKTNKFVGSRRRFRQNHKEKFYLLNRYDAQINQLLLGSTLEIDKLNNLEGREMILGIFDYRPFMVLDFQKYPRFYDRALNKSQNDVLIDGTDVRYMLEFCALKNCTVQADTSQTDWGYVYENATATGTFGMALERQVDYSVGAMYLWYVAYLSMDITYFLGRSGITCLVPSPTRLISWTLPLHPFQYKLWICVIACLFFEIFGLCLTRNYELLDDNRRSLRKKSSYWLISLNFSAVTTLKLFINQSTNYVVNAMSVRLVLLACYMIDIIVTSIYSGGLASILTLPILDEAADSRERLFKHNLVWTGTSEAWTMGIDGETEDPITLGLLKQFRAYPAEYITSYSRTENMGFIVERMAYGHLGNSELIADEALDRLKLMIDDIYFAYYVAYVPRIWPFLTNFNNFILIWHSSGFDKFWEWKIAADYMNANRQNRIVASQRPNLDNGPVKLGMDNFMGLVIIWLFGMGVSLLVFIIELTYYYYFH